MDYRAVIQDSLDYIETNIAAEVSAQELADRACFSLFHYYRLFQTATGMPVMQYILRRRLLHAIYAVRCGSSGIDAAMKYGFDTYAGFYKAFRREFGCTPSHFLKTCRAQLAAPQNIGTHGACHQQGGGRTQATADGDMGINMDLYAPDFLAHGV